MKCAALAACFALTIVAFPRIAAAQAHDHANSPKAEFHLSAPLTVGATTLKPGDYKFQCKRIDGMDFLVITSTDDDREVARVPCRPQDLVDKTKVSEMRTIPTKNGGRALSAVRIKGERIAHLVVTE